MPDYIQLSGSDVMKDNVYREIAGYTDYTILYLSKASEITVSQMMIGTVLSYAHKSLTFRYKIKN